MKINISAPYNQVLYVSTDNYTTVYGVKVAISNILRIAIQNLHIFKGSTELKDFQVCSACFPDKNAIVSCQVIESESKFKSINTQLPEKSYISFLKNLGFPENQIDVALLYANNNIQHALELLINRANVIIEKTTHEENPSYENETILSNFEIKQKEIEDKFNFANSNFSVIQSIESLSVPVDSSLNQQLIDAYASNQNSRKVWNDLREQFPQLSDISIKRSIFSMLDDIKHQREVNFKIPETLLKDPMFMRGQTSNTSEIIIPHPPKEVINIVELTENFIKSHRNIKDLQQNSFQNCSQSYLAYILYIIARKLMKLKVDEDWDFSEIRLLTEIMYPHLKNSFNATNIHKALSRSRSDENINNEKILIKFILLSSPVYSLIPQIITVPLEIKDPSYLDNGIPTYLDELLEKLSNNEKIIAVIENMNQFPPHQPIEPNLTENINTNNVANHAETNQQLTNTHQRAQSQPVPPKTATQPAPAANPPQPSTRQQSEPITEPQKQPETQNSPEAPPPPKRGRPGRPKIEWLKEEDQILIDVVCANNDRSAYNMASSMLPRRKPHACISRFKELTEKIINNEINYLRIPDNFLTCPNVMTATGRHDKTQSEPVNTNNNNSKPRELIKGEFTDQQLIDIIAQTMTNNEPDLDAAAALFESLTPYHLLSKWDEVCFDIKCNGRKDLKIPEKLQNYLKPFDGEYKYEFLKLPDEPINVSRLLEQYIMNNYDLNKTHDSFSEYSIGYIAYIIVYMLNKYNKRYKPEPTFKDWRPIEDRILLEMMYNDEPLKDYSRYNPSKTQRHIANRKLYISRLLSSKVYNLTNILQASKVFNMEDSQLNEDFVPKYLPNLVKAAKNNHVIDATKANDPQNFALKTIYTKQDNQLIINKVAENINDPNKFNLIAIYFPGRNARELIQHYKYLLEEYRKGNLNDLVIPDCLKNEFVPAQRSPPRPAPPPPAPSPPSPFNTQMQINFNDDRLEYRIIDTYYNNQYEFKTIDKAYAMFILNYIVRRFTGQYGHWDSSQEKMLFMAQFMNKDITPLLGNISIEKWKNRYEVLPKLLADHKATMMMFAEKLASVKATRTENEVIPKYLVQTLNETIDQHKKKVVEQVSLTKQGLLNFVAHHRQYIDVWDLAYNHFKVMSPQEFNKSYHSLIYNIKNGIANDLIVPNNLMPDIYPKSYKYPSHPKEMVDIRKCVKVYFKNFDFDDCVKECKGTTHGYFLFIFTYMTRYFNSNKAFDFSILEDRVICELMGLNYPTNKINDVLDKHSAEDIEMRIKYIIESQANFDRVFNDFSSFDFNFSLEKATYNSVGIPSYLDGVVHAFSQSYFKSAHRAKKKAEQQKSKKKHVEEEQEEEEEEEISSDDDDFSYEIKSTGSSAVSSSSQEEEVKPKPKPVNFSIKSQELSIKPSISVETIHATTTSPHNNEEDITKYLGIESSSPVHKPRLVPIVVSSDSSSESEKHVDNETTKKTNKSETPIVVDSDSYSYYYDEEHADVETETTEDAQQPHNEENQNTIHEENVYLEEDHQQTNEETSSNVENQDSIHEENIKTVDDHQQINEEKTQENEEKAQDQLINEELSSHEEKIKEEDEQQQNNEEMSSHEEAQNPAHEDSIQQITEETTQEQPTTEEVQNEDQANEESTQAEQAAEEALNYDQQFNEESTTADDQLYIDHEQQFADEESIANTQIDESTEQNHDEENQEDNSTIQESHEESHVAEEQFDENETNPENQATDQQNFTEDVSQISEEPQSYIENHFASNEETHETLTEANDYENVSIDQDQQETAADENQEEFQQYNGNQEETQNDHEVENQEEFQQYNGSQYEEHQENEVENQEDVHQYNEEEEDKPEIFFVDTGSNNREIYDPLLLDTQQADENVEHTEVIQNEVQTNDEENKQETFNEGSNDQEIFGDISNAENKQNEENENHVVFTEQLDIPMDNSSTPLFTFQNPLDQEETQNQIEDAHNDDATYEQEQTQNDDVTNEQERTQNGEEIQQNDESVEQQNPNVNAENNEVQVTYEAPFENEEFIDTHNEDVQNQQNEESNDQNKQNENEEDKNSFEIDSLSSVQREDFELSEDRVESQDEDNFRPEQRQTTEESEHSQHEGASVDEILRRIQMNFQSNDFNSDQIEHPEPLKEDEIIQNLEHKAVEEQNEEIPQNNLQNQEENNEQQQNSFAGQDNFQNLPNQENQIENTQNQENNSNPQ